MLIRQTFLYLPAQLLPALAQFVSLIIWAHFTKAEVIGIVTLLVSIQEFLVLGLIGFWTNYTVRYASKTTLTPEEARALARTSTTVVIGSSLLQGALAIILYLALIDPHASPLILCAASCMVMGRAFNSFQAERGRGKGDILLYSITIMAGPVFGMALGIIFILWAGPTALSIMTGFALAQALAIVFGLFRDSSWISVGKPSRDILKHAIHYGLPLILSAVSSWLTQNVGRLLVNHFSGLAAAGIYALGFGLGFRVATVASMSVTAAAFPIAARHANAGRHDEAMAQLSKNVILLAFVLIPSMVGLALVGHDLLGIFISKTLRVGAEPIMLWAILGGTLICFRQHFLHQVFLLNGKTNIIGRVSMAETVFAVAVAALVVPRWSGLGAIISLVTTSGISTLAMLIFAIRAGLRPPWLDLGKITAATAAMSAVVLMTPAAADLPHLAERIAAGAVTFVVVILLLFFRQIPNIRPTPKPSPQ